MVKHSVKRLREELDRPRKRKGESTTEERRRWCDLYAIDNPRASLDTVRAAMIEAFGEAVGSDYIQASLRTARELHDEAHRHDLPVIGSPKLLQAAMVSRDAAVSSILDALKRNAFAVGAVIVGSDGSTRIELKEDEQPQETAAAS